MKGGRHGEGDDGSKVEEACLFSSIKLQHYIHLELRAIYGPQIISSCHVPHRKKLRKVVVEVCQKIYYISLIVKLSPQIYERVIPTFFFLQASRE